MAVVTAKPGGTAGQVAGVGALPGVAPSAKPGGTAGQVAGVGALPGVAPSAIPKIQGWEKAAAKAGAAPWQISAIASASAKWQIPAGLLWGVYGLETSFGENISTSSAGAMGAFQFIPSTARQYGYPMTNTPTPAQFAQQTEAAAHYLHDLYDNATRQHVNSAPGGLQGPPAKWDWALQHYSGGGYGLQKVIDSASGVFGKPDLGVQTPFRLPDSLAGFGKWFVDNLLHLVEILGGGLLLLMALKELTGGSIDPIGAVRRRL